MPHLQVHVGNRLASVHIDDLVVNNSVNALLGLDDVLADVFSSNIVGALGDIWGEDAAGVAAEQDACIRAGSVSKTGLVVVGGEDAVECALALEASLGPVCLDELLTSGHVSCLETASLELGAAVAEITGFGSRQEVTTFLGFLSNGVARVCGSHASQKSCEDGRCETHFG